MIKQNPCLMTFHEELEKEGPCSKYLGRVTLYGRPQLDMPTQIDTRVEKQISKQRTPTT